MKWIHHITLIFLLLNTHFDKYLFSYSINLNLGAAFFIPSPLPLPESLLVQATPAIAALITFSSPLETLTIFLSTSAFHTIASCLLTLHFSLFPYWFVLTANTRAIVTTCLSPSETFTIFCFAVWLHAATGNCAFINVFFKEIVNFTVLCK
jgi:hypothetical protein